MPRILEMGMTPLTEWETKCGEAIKYIEGKVV